MKAALMQVEKPLPPREARRTADTTFDRIYKSYFGKLRIELTEKETEIRDRWDFGFRMMCQAHTDRDIVILMMKKFGIAKPTAYDDIKNIQALFGDQKQANKEFKRLKAEHWIQRGIKKAWKNDKLLSYERLIGRYTKINGLELEPGNELADLVKKLKPHSITFVLDPEALKKQAKELMEDVPTLDTDYSISE